MISLRLLVALLLAVQDPGAPERAATPPTAVEWPAERDADLPIGNARPDEAEAPPKTETSKVTGPPPPRSARPPIDVAVGLDPSAPGTKAELALVDTLERSIPASTDPPSKVRRLRAGTPSAREVCRSGRDDLVILVGYVPSREEPVLLAHDCRLDHALDLRGAKAASEPGLAGVLWDEHEALVRDGVKERRRLKGLSPRARAGIIGGVAVVLIGVAVGVLVASALRDEKVVIKVSP